MPRDLDVVLFGATGFVGRLTADYLARVAPPELLLGLAGRSQRALAEVRRSLGERAAGWPLVRAESADVGSLRGLAARSAVVVTTVGPYLRCGLPLVQACAEAGTSYADLTGEVLFVRRSIDACHATAERSGARIVHSCGFDSVPSDLAVLLAADRARADGSGTLQQATLLAAMSGGFSGGTVDSLRVQVDAARQDPTARRLLADPYALTPDPTREPSLGAEGDAVGIRWEPALGSWTAPFVMASYNTRIVRRSNALQDYAYGRTLRYREVTGTGRGLLSPAMAAAVAGGVAGSVVGMSLPPTRAILDRLLPKPGQGPGARVRERGWFRMRLHAATTEGATYLATVAASGDPGYNATSVMLGESALALACDELPDRGGVLTPAVALGGVLPGRLRAAGFEVSVARIA